MLARQVEVGLVVELEQSHGRPTGRVGSLAAHYFRHHCANAQTTLLTHKHTKINNSKKSMLNSQVFSISFVACTFVLFVASRRLRNKNNNNTTQKPNTFACKCQLTVAIVDTVSAIAVDTHALGLKKMIRAHTICVTARACNRTRYFVTHDIIHIYITKTINNS